MSQGLTLFDIETDLLNLMLCREAVLGDYHTPDGERSQELAEIDQAIQERVSAEIAKVDGIAFYLREFAARAAAAKAEKKRLADREAMWEAREERLKEIVTQVMLMTGKTRLEGNSNTLKLVKNPPSVEIAQLAMVPEQYLRATVAMSADSLETLKLILEAYESQHSKRILAELNEATVKLEAMKTPISEALKRGDGVPGCSLVRDKMRLVVE
jgi:Siphovirus Gp157